FDHQNTTIGPKTRASTRNFNARGTTIIVDRNRLNLEKRRPQIWEIPPTHLQPRNSGLLVDRAELHQPNLSMAAPKTGRATTPQKQNAPAHPNEPPRLFPTPQSALRRAESTPLA
ncbi:MAG: hypothetical protein ACI92A_000728, partial [Candidatus Paceibacteria bacterium]